MKKLHTIINGLLITAALALCAFATACLNPPRDNAADRWGEDYDSVYSEDAITSFMFTVAANSTVTSTNLDSVIEEETITVYVPYGMDKRSLVATFEADGISVMVNGVEQRSGLTANDFTVPAVYTVTALDGSEHAYTVAVEEVMIHSFSVTYPLPGNGTGTAAGTIDHDAKTISISIPYSSSLSALPAQFDTGHGFTMTVDGTGQISGVTVNDYTSSAVSPLGFLIAAPNGIFAEYRVATVLGALNVGHFAGTVGGAGFVDGTGIDARFHASRGITTDGTNLYVADFSNHTIRKITIATGEVTTFAGLAGNPGSADGVGNDARFNYPWGITTDGACIYVADNTNHTIRRINIASREVTTLAGLAGITGTVGGIGDAARFNFPRGITTDGANLYVTDYCSVRKIEIASRKVTLIAGSATEGSSDGIGGAASFRYPTGITTDRTNLYVADTNNGRIRKVVISTGVVTTLPVTCSCPHGITTDGVNLYVANTDGHTIQKFVIATNTLTTLAGASGVLGSTDGTGSAARFNRPMDLTVQGSALYVADADNNVIRKVIIDPADVTTVAGMAVVSGSSDGTGSEARFFKPQGITTDGTNLYVADTGNNAIRTVAIATQEVTTLKSIISPPLGIISHGADLFFTDSANIRKIVISTGEVTTIASVFNEPDGITTDGANLYVSDTKNFTIRKIVIATGEVTTFAGLAGSSGFADGVGSDARFDLPRGIITDGTNLYVVDEYANTVRKIILATAEVTTLAGMPNENRGAADGAGSAARFDHPRGITLNGLNLYVTDNYNSCIRVLSP